MAKDKDRTLNPAAAQRKADKNRALKKSKATVTAQRNERLARRNPERLQRQIDELKEAEANGSIKPREKQTLDQLERDVKAIRKARETLGEKAPSFGRGDRPAGPGSRGILGKRRRDGARSDGPESSDTDSDLGDIPMPRDTPPPIPRPQGRRQGGNQNRTDPQSLPDKPQPAPQKVYSSAPQMRNLQKEATARFMPTAVARNVASTKGQGKANDTEELSDKLESQGYRPSPVAISDARSTTDASINPATGDDLEEEERRFERELEGIDLEGTSQSADRQIQRDQLTTTASSSGNVGTGGGRLHVELEEVDDEGS
jgi:hypothetical protein